MSNNIIIGSLVISIILFYLLNSMENFQDVKSNPEQIQEKDIHGLTNHPRINELQKEQDSDIDSLHEKLKLIIKMDELSKEKEYNYKKIKLEKTCRTIPSFVIDDDEVSKRNRIDAQFKNDGIELNSVQLDRISNTYKN